MCNSECNGQVRTGRSLLIMTQQSFNKQTNNIYNANDSVISDPSTWTRREARSMTNTM
jgi:hypothetical protein